MMGRRHVNERDVDTAAMGTMAWASEAAQATGVRPHYLRRNRRTTVPWLDLGVELRRWLNGRASI